MDELGWFLTSKLLGCATFGLHKILQQLFFCQLLDGSIRLVPSTSGLCMQTLECQSLLSSEIRERVVMLPSISQFRSHYSIRSLWQIHVKTARIPLSVVVSVQASQHDMLIK